MTICQLISRLCISTAIYSGLSQAAEPDFPRKSCAGTLDSPIVEIAKQGDTFIQGRLLPSQWQAESRLNLLLWNDDKKRWDPLPIGSTPVDLRWGTFRIEVLGDGVPDGIILITHQRGELCADSMPTAVPDTFGKGMWLNWSGAIAIRDRDVSVSGTAGPSVSLIRAIVTSPRAVHDMGDASTTQPATLATSAPEPPTSRSPGNNLIGLAGDILRSPGSR